ncbi:hypothetical protein FBZ98_11511 [Rhizobium sp. ERR 922]|uniref:hypothetical protein n=1 Tax=unclassified Rhizobium TaxID=2613769 RepID=UPI0011A59B82|nr:MULTISPECIES: hypothetical protein [unclassified Rhizobium]TWB45541.1 hypothetical protein FBZ98_11511 [Rhizobium sp. ERR 922]TWB88224.1 hypothetical protein FBZ97_11447 [Rhizobium sp. ERR 942]
MEVDEIDIDSLDEAALISLHDRIVARLQLLDLEKAARALRQIKIGGRVIFEGRTIRWSAALSSVAIARH